MISFLLGFGTDCQIHNMFPLGTKHCPIQNELFYVVHVYKVRLIQNSKPLSFINLVSNYQPVNDSLTTKNLELLGDL